MGFNCWLPQQLDISRNTLIYNTHRKYRRRKNVFCYRTVLPNAIRRNFLNYFFIIWTKRANQEGDPRTIPWTTQFIGPTLLKEIDINTISKSNRLETIGEEDKDR